MLYIEGLKARFGGLVVRIHIRMILARQPAISLLDLVRLRVALDAEYFVVILLSHCSLSAVGLIANLPIDGGV